MDGKVLRRPCGGGGGLLENFRSLARVCRAEKHQRRICVRLDAAIGIVDVDVCLAEARGGAAQLTRTVRKLDLRHFRLGEIGALALEHRFHHGWVVDDHAHQAPALERQRLERQDVDVAVAQRAAKFAERARAILHSNGELLGGWHWGTPPVRFEERTGAFLRLGFKKSLRSRPTRCKPFRSRPVQIFPRRAFFVNPL